MWPRGDLIQKPPPLFIVHPGELEGMECDWWRNAVPLSHLGCEFTRCGRQRTSASPFGRKRKSVWLEVVCGSPSCGCWGAHNSQCQCASLAAHLRAKLPRVCNQREQGIAAATETLAAGAVVKYGLWKPNRATVGLIFHLTFVRDLFQPRIFYSYYRGDDLLAVTSVRCLFLGNWCFCLVLCLQAYRDEEWRLRDHQTIMQNAGHFKYLYRDHYFYNPCEWKQKDCILFSLIFHRYCTVAEEEMWQHCTV